MLTPATSPKRDFLDLPFHAVRRTGELRRSCSNTLCWLTEDRVILDVREYCCNTRICHGGPKSLNPAPCSCLGYRSLNIDEDYEEGLEAVALQVPLLFTKASLQLQTIDVIIPWIWILACFEESETFPSIEIWQTCLFCNAGSYSRQGTVVWIEWLEVERRFANCWDYVTVSTWWWSSQEVQDLRTLFIIGYFRSIW